MILSVNPLRWKKKVTKATTTMTNVSTNVDTMWKPICRQFCKKNYDRKLHQLQVFGNRFTFSNARKCKKAVQQMPKLVIKLVI